MKRNKISNVFQTGWQGMKLKRRRSFFVRRNYKDRLFLKLFQDKKSLLDLYNALNQSAYTNTEELIITTLDDVVYMGMKNDCSFIIGSYLNLYEHQSTFCPNMPVRGLIYLVHIYEAYIKQQNFNLYGEKQIILPTPKYIVFYNGTDEHEDVEYLKLSDAFEEGGTCLEFTATMYNINMGHNQHLMQQCDTLQGYSVLVAKVREYQKLKYAPAEAIDMACEYCINHNILRDFLIMHRSEVGKVLLTEYNEKEQRKLDQRDAHADGKAEGMEIGIEHGVKIGVEHEIFQSVFEKDYSMERGMEKLKVSKEVFEKKYQEWLKENRKQ